MNQMKTALDFGTMLSNDPAKLRAFKEQIKKSFKKDWLDLAEALESFGIITPCGCADSVYCKVCGGSRYRLSEVMSPDAVREISVVLSPDRDDNLQEKLTKGLEKALREIGGSWGEFQYQ
jgi:hypothetical protein